MVGQEQENEIYVTKEFAILFKRVKNTDKVTEFIPFKVIEGTYVEEDGWFMDNDEVVYPHIAEPMYSGIGYAGRITDTVPLKDATEEYYEYFKNEQLSRVSEYIYVRDISKDYYITIIDKKTYENYIMEDDDTERIYGIYDEEENSNSFVINATEEGKKLVTDTEGKYEPKMNKTPVEIKNEITKTIRGQDEAVEKIVTAIWTSYKFAEMGMSKKNMLVVGPSGVGKTAIFRKLQKVLDLPLSIYDISGTSQSGYVGRSVDDILTQVYYDNNEDIAKAERSIVILDEIDKLAYGPHNTGDISTSGVQNELLKIIEGTERTVQINQNEGIMIDTSKMIFVGTGAFEEVYNKEEERKPIGFGNIETKNKKILSKTNTLNDYGLKKQLIGRLSTIVELRPMTKEILKDIILNSDESELKITLNAIESMGVKVNNVDMLIDIICEDAIKRNIGARGLVGTINNIFLNIFYEVANNPDKYSEVHINSDILFDDKSFELIPKRVKKLTKTK